MKEIKIDFIKSIARVMANCFVNDPLMQETLKDIRNKKEFIYEQGIIQMQYYFKYMDVYILDDKPNAFLVGIDSNNTRKFRELILNLKVIVRALKILNFQERKKIISNNKRIAEVLSFDWHKCLINGRYYRIKIIAVDKDLRGTGAFRRLISPVINYCDEHKIPMVIETHNYANVGIYEHFGFRLVKTLVSSGVDVKQYCMIRYPQKS